MGPVMPPSKKPESSGISVSSGLSQRYRGSGFSKALQEDDDLDFPLPDTRLEEGAMEDEELTNLNWLHESKNLLKSFGDSVLRSVSPVQDPDDDPPPSPAHSDVPYDARQNPNCKPPYSFSCLIFMAIEDSPTKRLPVKDIYNWILEHFPYFANAPTGWKNSVRHNLSLNKCFKKVDKERSQSIGKGSLWCIDPEYRQNLIQALKKTPYHPHSNVFNTPPASPQAYQRTCVVGTREINFLSENSLLLSQVQCACEWACRLGPLSRPLERAVHGEVSLCVRLVVVLLRAVREAKLRGCAGLPWWLSEESTSRCRRCGFAPWSGRSPRGPEQLSPSATAAACALKPGELQLQSPRAPAPAADVPQSPCSATGEAAAR